MKRTVHIGLLVLLVVLATACTSSVRVTRLDADAELDLSGSWNDTDIRIVTEALIESSLDANWINQFRMRNGHNPW